MGVTVPRSLPHAHLGLSWPDRPHAGWMSEARAQLSCPVRRVQTPREPSGSRRVDSLGKEGRGSPEELFLKREIKKMGYAQGQATFVLGLSAALVVRRGGGLGELICVASPISRPWVGGGGQCLGTGLADCMALSPLSYGVWGRFLSPFVL